MQKSMKKIFASIGKPGFGNAVTLLYCSLAQRNKFFLGKILYFLSDTSIINIMIIVISYIL